MFSKILLAYDGTKPSDFAFERAVEVAQQAHAPLHLARMIRRHGGSPAEGGTTGAAIHRGWVHVKGAVGANSELSLLEECERGEEPAVARYREAMQRNMPPDVRDLVERQAASAQQSHDQLKVLRDEARTRG